MKTSLFHLNIRRGEFIDRVVKFIKKNDFDFINLQEVTGGKFSFNEIDCFEYLKQNLPDYDAEIGIAFNLVKDKNSYFANATFFKKSFELKDKYILELKPYKEIKDFQIRKIEDDPRNALFLTFNMKGKHIKIINTHLAWGTTSEDKPYKLEQAKKLYECLKTLKNPFVLSGDFNVGPNSQIVKWFNELAANLTVENNISNTLNPKTHYAKEKIFPPGIAVDYIFVDKSIRVNKFELIDKVDLSDHYGLLLEFEV